MKTCNYCGKPLTLTPEYDMCMECQGRIMRESTIPQGAFATNSTHPQMITQDLVIMGLEVIKKNSTNKVDIAIIDDAIKLIKYGGELKRDVKRYFELEQTHCELHEIDEYYDLYEKLSKVGV